jgi:iron complex outermembrane receptor protein
MHDIAHRNGLCGAAAALALAAGLVATPAMAQDTAPAADSRTGLEEIVVTAQRRAENLQDVPIAVSAITSATLANTGIDTTKDLPQLVPSVQFTRSGPSGLFFVRGVGTTNAAAGEEGANAVYVDGVYMADLGQTINTFNNIERVEVLKGPQGTLFGRNSTGGLIHIITREPGSETVMTGEIGFANYVTPSAKVYAGGPISDTLSADIALTTLYQDQGWGHYVSPSPLDGREAHTQAYGGARSKLVFRPSAGVKLVLAGDYFRQRDNLGLAWKLDTVVPGSVGTTGPSGFDVTSNKYAQTDREVYGVSLTGEFDLGFATLTSISAYRQTSNHSEFDVDGAQYDLIDIDYDSGSKSFQQELRLASNETEPFSWQIGGFYLHSEADNDSTFFGGALAAVFPELSPGVTSTVGTKSQAISGTLSTNSYAVFGEATYSITPTTHLTGGIRYTMDRRHYIASQFTTLYAPVMVGGVSTSVVPSGLYDSGGNLLAVPGEQDSRLSYNAVTWRVALRQELTPDINLYASVNRGFKSGSYSLQNPLNLPYDPQFIMAYEAGIKAELLDRRLRFNLAGFHYDIDDYQVRSAAVANPGSSLILNAATVKVDGVELEFEAAPTDQLRLFGGVTWLNSRYDKFGGPGAEFQAPIVYPKPATCPDPGTADPGELGPGPRTGGYQTCFGDVSGNKVSNAPEWSLSLGATYTVPMGVDKRLRFSALYSYNSGYYFEPDNYVSQDAFSLLNLSAEYRTGGLGLEVWARNVTDTEYAVQKLSTSTGTTTALGAPRTYGVTVKWDIY